MEFNMEYVFVNILAPNTLILSPTSCGESKSFPDFSFRLNTQILLLRCLSVLGEAILPPKFSQIINSSFFKIIFLLSINVLIICEILTHNNQKIINIGHSKSREFTGPSICLRNTKKML